MALAMVLVTLLAKMPLLTDGPSSDWGYLLSAQQQEFLKEALDTQLRNSSLPAKKVQEARDRARRVAPLFDPDKQIDHIRVGTWIGRGSVATPKPCSAVVFRLPHLCR